MTNQFKQFCVWMHCISIAVCAWLATAYAAGETGMHPAIAVGLTALSGFGIALIFSVKSRR